MILDSLRKYNAIIKNISSLSVLQVSNYLFPLLSFPYLVRVLGPEGYGLVSFASSLVGYFANLTEFGFGFSATQKMALIINEEEKARKYFWSVIFVKFLFFVVGLVLFIVLVFSFEKFHSDYELYLVLYFSILGSILFPNWFYQAIEKMSYIVRVNVIVKIIWLLLIFLMIQEKDDILIYVVLNSFSSIVIGIYGLFIATYRLKIKFYLPSLNDLITVIIEGKYLFYQRISAMLYTNSNTFLLGLFFSNEVVGYFTAVDKIRMALQGLMGNITQSVYPFLTKLFEKSFSDAKQFILKYLFKSIVISIIIVSVLSFYSEEIVLTVLGKQYLSSILIFKILIFAPAIIWISNILGIHIMLSMGFQKQFFKISLYASFLHFIILPVFIFQLSAVGVAYAIVITELSIVINQSLFLKRKEFFNEETK